jgi:hypothetical protein
MVVVAVFVALCCSATRKNKKKVMAATLPSPFLLRYSAATQRNKKKQKAGDGSHVAVTFFVTLQRCNAA